MDTNKIKNGWKTQEEFSYWIPECDIEGKVPEELHGTFIRNGPGLDEVYGKTLKHGKQISIVFVISNKTFFKFLIQTESIGLIN